MRIPQDDFPSQVDASDPTNYPWGKAQDIVSPGDGSGTPWKQLIINDIFGFFQRVIYRTATTPNSSNETVMSSQIADALGIMAARALVMKGKEAVNWVALRGSSRGAPENTLIATELAGKAGYYGCHGSIRLTSDNAWVLIEDETVDRTTPSTGDVDTFTEAAITALDAGIWYDSDEYYSGTVLVPTFYDFLVKCKLNGMHPFIEIKPSGDIGLPLNGVYETAYDVYPDYNYTLMSNNIVTLQTLRGFRNESHLMLIGDLTDSVTDPVIMNALSLGHCDVAASPSSIVASPSAITRARNEGIEVYAYNATTYGESQSAIEGGASGVISPNLIKEER